MMQRRTWWWVLGGLGALALLFLLGVYSVLTLARGGGPALGSAVGLLRLEGTIVSAEDFVEQVEAARKDRGIKAVVLRVESPGGSVGASQEIYAALQRLAAAKPLVASFGNVAASGGYYAGIAAQYVFALPGTITASIGVRMSHLDASEFLQLLHLKPDILKSGQFKDVGAMHRPMRAEERALLEDLLRAMHVQFKAAVAARRGLTAEQVDAIADGRVVTGEAAVQAKLVDAVGDLHDAVVKAGELAGLGPEPRVIDLDEDRPWLLRVLLGERRATWQAWGRLLSQPMIGYYWAP
ncbi:MAG: signal peptide peptidase SppA [Deltaproteobacteria bacterium]|nr:signal peptide peptidase SppA [Deltaproteobacteria bacterium]